MASDLITNQDIRARLNGLDLSLQLPADDTVMSAFVDEADAYIREGWGPHPTDETSADYLTRRAALVMLVNNRFRGNYTVEAMVRACANIEYRGIE